MATTLFDRPLFVQRKHYVEEIASLEDAFDVLEAWPADQRGLQHEVLMNACQEAANGRFPISAVRLNLERFLRKAGVLPDIKHVPNSLDWYQIASSAASNAAVAAHRRP